MENIDLSKNLSGIILAGGESERFGEKNKAIANFQGKPIIQHIVEILYRSTNEKPVVVVKRKKQKLQLKNLKLDVKFVFDEQNFDGPLGGVLGGIKSISSDWFFLCGCDMPLLSQSAIFCLAKYIKEDPDAIAPVDEGLQPLHSIYNKNAVFDIREKLKEEKSIKSIFNFLDEIIKINIDDTTKKTLSDSLYNVNTRENLKDIK